MESFWEVFIGEAIEGDGLMCGGACGREWDVAVMRPRRASATEIDRARLAGWFENHPEIQQLEQPGT